MEKPIFLARKPSPNLLPYIEPCGLKYKTRIMIIDFSQNCNTYDKRIYQRESFSDTLCPKCPAIGRFKLFGSYQRYVVYFAGEELIYELIDIKRIMCKSCKSTHAVMPGDLIPYKLLSLAVIMLFLTAHIVEETPVLRIANEYGLSFQIIWLCLSAFYLFKNRIHQYFKEISSADTPLITDCKNIIGLIIKPYIIFQRGYVMLNRRPCFMSKFLDGVGAPPIGLYAP
jgi:hypothetical protein